jgi:hypothetical protein
VNALLPDLRRHRLAVALLVIPLLLLRSMVPQGFMPVAAADGLIGLCPDAAPLPPGIAGGHLHHHHGGPPGNTSHHFTACVFAASATVAGAPTLSTLPLAPSGALRFTSLTFPSLHLPAIVRAQSSRAPPLLPL